MQVTYWGFAQDFYAVAGNKVIHPGDTLDLSQQAIDALTAAGHTLVKAGEPAPEGAVVGTPVGIRTVVTETPTRTPYESSNGVAPYVAAPEKPAKTEKAEKAEAAKTK